MTRTELFTDCQPLVERALRCCHIQESGIDDARQAAYEALWLATARCDPERAPFFRAYAKQVVFGAVKNWLDRENPRTQEEPDGITARPAETSLEPASEVDVEAELCEAIDQQRVRRVRLRRCERGVVNASLRGLSAAEYARRIGVCPTSAKEWRAAAIERLRAAILGDEADTQVVIET